MSEYSLGLQGRPYPYHVDTNADHWWPKGLQRLWVDADGYVSRVKPSGKVDRKKAPKNGSRKGFGHKRGGHRIVFGKSPWNHTFEPEFDEIDREAPTLLTRMAKRLSGEDQDLFGPASGARTADTLVKLCFSLLIRSPAFRYRKSFGGKLLPVGMARGVFYEELGTQNISKFWRSTKGINLRTGNICTLTLLHSSDAEFCFGDGLYDAIFNRSLGLRPEGNGYVPDLAGDALVPLLPDLCAYLHFQRSRRGCSIHIRDVDQDMVAEVNHLTQVYSKEQIFFRTQTPILNDEYKRVEHLMIKQGITPKIGALRAQIESL